MQSVIVSAAVGLLAFAMGLVGLYLKRHLPERQLSTGSRDMIGAIIGLLSLLLALVLGILVGSAHQFFAGEKAEIAIARLPLLVSSWLSGNTDRSPTLATDDESFGAGGL